jgi:D-arabinose 1-dehydrogenase-like Zn-dependent alcohol dehydrogenase
LEDRLGIRAIDSSVLERATLPQSSEDQVDVVVDLVGRGATLEWSLGHLATSGQLAVLTTFCDVSAAFSPRDVVLRQTSILGSRHASRSELSLAAHLLAQQRVEAIIGESVPLEQTAELLRRISAGEVIGRGAVLVDGEDRSPSGRSQR